MSEQDIETPNNQQSDSSDDDSQNSSSELPTPPPLEYISEGFDSDDDSTE